jgi:hypothetical protein
MHANEPVYQALFFTLDNVRKRRKRMEEELSIRDTGPIV